jgi:hypothetical protein
MGSISIPGMCVDFSQHVFLCAGRDLAMGLSPVQGSLRMSLNTVTNPEELEALANLICRATQERL